MTRGVPKSGVRRAASAPSAEDRAIADYVAYDPDTGAFTWKITNGPRALTGSRAGSAWRRLGAVRYVIRFRHRGYQANRVAWLIMTGEWPSTIVDHRDGDGLNNRWANFRAATPAQNAANARIRKDNTVGLKGVTLRGSRYVVRIQANKRRISVGSFRTAQEAALAYREAAETHHAEFRRVS